MEDQPTQQSINHRTILLTTAVALVMLIATALAGYATKLTVDQKLSRFFERQADQIGITYHANLATHIAVLGGLRGLWNTEGSFNQTNFSTYINSLDLDTTYKAGVSSFFYIPLITNGGGDHYPITYIEPLSGRENALGTDFATLPDYLTSIEYARDRNVLAITQSLATLNEDKPNFLFLLPLYESKKSLESPGERKQAFRGVVGTAFRADFAFAQLFGAGDPYPYLDFQIYQGEATDPEHLLYDHDTAFSADRARFSASRVLRIQGQTWTINVQSKPDFALADAESRLPVLVLISGIVGATLLVLFSVVQNLAYLKRTKRFDSRQEE